CGVARFASKFWKPPMPELYIHVRSLRMPSLVIFPCIQCHHTRGLAELGGVVKLVYKLSFNAGCLGWANSAADANSAAEMESIVFIILVLLVRIKGIVFCWSPGKHLFHPSILSHPYKQRLHPFFCWLKKYKPMTTFWIEMHFCRYIVFD